MSQKEIIVKILPYNSNWPNLFEEGALKIRQALGENCTEIHHIGSTSVPGLDAKPIIDMIPVVQNILRVDSVQVIANMKELGFMAKGENGIPFRRFFCSTSANIHVFEKSSPEIEHHLTFRNYLRQNPSVCQEYAALKKKLAVKHPYDVNQYSLGKSTFITNVEREIGFDGIFLRNCHTDFEWEEFHNILGTQEGNNYYSKGNADKLKEKDCENFYFVLYKGPSSIIAATHLCLKSNLAETKSLALLSQFIHHEPNFIELLQLWTNHRGCDLIISKEFK